MQIVTLWQEALILKMVKEKFACRFKTWGASQDDVNCIRDVMAKRVNEAGKKALVEYLNVMIGGKEETYLDVKRMCEDALFKKLKKAGLKKV
jgi:hypothetical protein